MSCEHMICAQCAGPVAEGRCPVCRASRAQVHHHSRGLGLPYTVVLLLLMLALLITMQRLR